MIIKENEKDHILQIDRIESEAAERENMAIKAEEKLRHEVFDLKNKVSGLQEQVEEMDVMVKLMEQQTEQKEKELEEEVKLRKYFESTVSNQECQIREANELYKRACNDIADLESLKKFTNNMLAEVK